MGNKFGVVSGRPPDLAEFLQTEYALSLDFLVAFNGGWILDSDGKEIFKAACEEVELYELVRDLFSWDCPFAHVNSDKYYLVYREKKDLRAGAYLLENLPQNLSRPRLLHQVSVQLSTVEEAAKTTAKIEEKYGEFLSPLQNGVCIDIVPRGVNKAQGLQKVAEFFHANTQDIITVGDNINDKDMLQAFTSYAMENGVEEIKAIAGGIVSSVTELIEEELKKERV